MEEVLEVIGNNGKFQKKIIYICILTSLLTTIYSLQISFLTKRPNFNVSELNDEKNMKNIHTKYNENICNFTKYSIEKDKKSVHNWSYEFNLYCNKDYLNVFIVYSVLIGLIIGPLILSYIPDKYGRKTIFKTLVIISLINHFNLILSLNVFHIILINFIGGILGFTYSMGFYIILEYIRNDLTGFVLGLYNAIYPFFGVFLSFFFLTINNFRIYFILTFLLSLLLLYLTLNYFSESPKWLHSMGKKEECLKVLNKIAIINGKEKEWKNFQNKYPEIIKKIGIEQLNNINTRKNYNIFEILSFKSQRKKIILLCFICFSSGMNFFGIFKIKSNGR